MKRNTDRPNTAGYKLGYIPPLDGLRSFAVLAVIAYHMGLPWVAGGLLGVTVFFVLSGYLITSLLVQELQQTDSINLPQFWLRRVRRLVPAIVLVICVTAILCGIFNHGLLTKMRPDIIPSLFFFNNWWQILHDVSYFDAMGAPSPLAHFWSLAIEEQFYLMWPVFLLLAHRFGVEQKTLCKITIGLIVISVLDMAILFTPDGDPSRVYYGTDTRAFSLLIGSLLAFLWPAAQLRSSKKAAEVSQQLTLILDGVGSVALVGLFIMFAFADGLSPFLYRGGLLLCSLLTAVVIASTVHPASLLGRVIGCKPLVWIGKRSYGMYLWHYPLILLLMPLFPGHTEPAWFLVVELILIFVVSALSYTFVENPIRKGALRTLLSDLVGARPVPSHQRDVRQMAKEAWASRSSQKGYPSQGYSVQGRHAQSRKPMDRIDRITSIIGVGAQRRARIICGAAVLVVAGACLAVAFTPEEAQDENTKRLIAMQEQAESEARQAEIEANIAKTKARVANLNGDSSAWQLLLIGDSVPLGASDLLLERFPESIVDAAVSRNASDFLSVYQTYMDQGWQGSGVIVAAGTNGPLYDALDEIGAAVEAEIPLFVVTERAPHVDWQDDNNKKVWEFVASRDNTYVIDWYSYSNDHPEYFYDDDTHLNENGRVAYVDLLESSIREDFPLE